MNVALRFKRELHVDDTTDVRDVDAAAGDVGRYEHADLALAETFECARALILGLVGVDGRARDVLAEELLVHAVGAVAHLGEDDHLGPFGMRLQEMDEKGVLLGLLDEHDLLVDLFDGRRLRGDRDHGGIADEFAGEVADLRGHRGAEEKRLARLWKL